MNNVLSLRDYINNRDSLSDDVKAKTFCRLMKKVVETIEKEERNLIKINIDDIKINIDTGEIILSNDLFGTDSYLDKTIANFNTGISLMAERKSSKEHKTVSFALMILGWYYNPNGTSIPSDIEVLENFDMYMEKVPEWLRDYFIKVFRNMNYDLSFSTYYDENFTGKIKKDVEKAFSEYNLTDEQYEKIYKILMKDTNKRIKEGVKKFKDGEQQVLDTYEDVLNELKENITRDVKPVVENNPVDNSYFFTNENVGQQQEQSKGMTRVLTMDNMPKTLVDNKDEPGNQVEYYYGGTSSLDKGAFSNTLIIAAVLALIAIVVVVTLSILKYINNF